MKNVGEKSPRVELELIGPCADLTIRRQILASDDLFKKACLKPRIRVRYVFVFVLLICTFTILLDITLIISY